MIIKRRHIGYRSVALLFFMIALTTGSYAQSDPTAPIKSLSFQNADVKQVIGFLADYSQVNIVTAPEVEGNVTLNLQQVTWREALNILCKTYSYTAVEEKGYIRILPTKDYLAEVSTLEKHKFERERLVELQTVIFDIDNAHAEDLVKTVKPLLSERGKVQIDKRTNSVVVRDIPSSISKIGPLVNSLDRPTRQIKISAQLVEVSTSALAELGIDWTAIGSKTTSSGKTYDHTTKQNLNRVAESALDFTFTTVQDSWSLQAAVSVLVGEGKGKIVAHPEIITVENKEARIQMGQKIPIKQFDVSGNVVVSFEEVGTLLRVTPHITSENRILMTLRPERSTYEYDPNGVVINTSNANTSVLVENGQTAVIGGLTTQDVTTSVNGVPILKDIPLLGYLFSYKRKKVENRDLIIFVTPTVVEDGLADFTPTPEASDN